MGVTDHGSRKWTQLFTYKVHPKKGVQSQTILNLLNKTRHDIIEIILN